MSSETVQKTLEALGKRKDGGLFGTGSDEPTLPTQEPYIKALIKSLPLSQSGTKGTSLDQIEGEIEKTTFVLETAQPTLADAALFLALHPVLAEMQTEDQARFPNILRYMSLLARFDPFMLPLKEAASLETLDLSAAKERARQIKPARDSAALLAKQAAEAKALKEKAKGDAQAAGQKKTSAPVSVAAELKPKKEKKERQAQPAKVEAAATTPIPSMIELKVGKIVSVKKHPEADSLYVEQIDVGEAEPRTVVSGLVNYIPIEEMQDKVLVCVCNLKPANMRGIKSFAMVLAATSKDGKGGPGSVELMQPPAGSVPGDRVYFEGFEDHKPETQLNPKKKIFETVQPGFTTLEDRQGAWINPENGQVHKIKTDKGPVLAPTHIGASLS